MRHSVEEALRRSHCSRPGEEHGCAGTLTITAKGIDLACTLCGSMDDDALESDYRVVDRAKAIVGALGIRWTSLSTAAQVAVCREVGRDHCPGCRRMNVDPACACACGEWARSSYGGWQRRDRP